MRNGDTWQVVDVHPDGALTVQETAAKRDQKRMGQVWLDPHYVAEHVQLGYAITAHRAQGATVGTCHVVVTPGMTREAFYVAMTRGRHANTTYVITERTDLEQEEHLQPSTEPSSTQQILRAVLITEGTERSASEQIRPLALQRGPRHVQTTAPVPGHRKRHLPGARAG